MKLEPAVEELFGGGHVVHLTTLRADGAPQSRPVWTIVRADNIVFFTQPGSPKARDIARDPRVALSVTDRENSYRSAWVRGTAGSMIEGGPALEIIDLIALAYIGEPFPMRSGIVFVIDTEAQGTATLPFRDPE